MSTATKEPDALGQAPLIAAEDAVELYLGRRNRDTLTLATLRVLACWEAMHRGPVVGGWLWLIDAAGELTKVPAAMKGGRK